MEDAKLDAKLEKITDQQIAQLVAMGTLNQSVERLLSETKIKDQLVDALLIRVTKLEGVVGILKWGVTILGASVAGLLTRVLVLFFGQGGI